LIDTAYENGLDPPRDYKIKSKKLSGGAVTEYVWRVSSTLPFAFKASRNPDLARQATTLRDLRNSEILPASCRELFPRVYSSSIDVSPFAYIMEFFGDAYTNLRDYLFAGKSPRKYHKVIERVVNVLFDLFRTTVQPNLIPNLTKIYIDRIRERMDGAKGANPKFKALVESPIVICSEDYAPYVWYLEQVQERLPKLSPPYCTFVHGDPHPGNIFFKLGAGGPTVKLIDPKAWIWGDYIFDVGKFVHYLLVTGPVEDGRGVQVRVRGGSPTRVDYKIVPPPPALQAVKVAGKHLTKFAKSIGDPHYRIRLNLSLASNLLGLCENRLKRHKPLNQNAVIYYCEGLRYLRLVAEGLT
jgi:hypothetical protein